MNAFRGTTDRRSAVPLPWFVRGLLYHGPKRFLRSIPGTILRLRRNCGRSVVAWIRAAKRLNVNHGFCFFFFF
jgi:hypothetical protein